jgi:ATP-dependent Clp protease ATP-binding subunit ClpC
LKTTFLESKVFQSSSVSTAHLLLCILRNENDPTTKLLNKLKIDYDVAKEQYINMTPNEEEFLENLPKRRTPTMTIQDKMTVLKKVILIIQPTNLIKKSKTPVLDNGRDLTEMAEEGKLDLLSDVRKKSNVFAKFEPT